MGYMYVIVQMMDNLQPHILYLSNLKEVERIYLPYPCHIAATQSIIKHDRLIDGKWMIVWRVHGTCPSQPYLPT